MGLTGVGKSTFVQAATRDPNATIGYGLQSETHQIMEFPCVVNSQTVTLVDMPGFDDSDILNTETLAQTTDWLRQAFVEKRKLSAIIYLHRITDRRVPGSAKQNLNMFRDLCGKNFYADLMLVTTLWDPKPPQWQLANEKQLKTDPKLWQDMIQGKAKYSRFPYYSDPLGSKAHTAAQEIIKSCLDNTPAALQVQEEMVVQKLPADQTSAGKTMNAELDKVKSEYDALVIKLQDQAANEKNEMMKKVFEAQEESARAKAEAAERSKQLLAHFSSAAANSTTGSDDDGPSPQSPSGPSILSPASITSLLITAVKSNDTRTARRLMHTNNADANTTDSRRRPVLNSAVENNYYDMVRLLLDNGARPTSTDKHGMTALHVAAREGYLHITKRLIESARTLEKRDPDGRTALYVACENNRERVARALLDQGAKVHTKSSHGNTVLHAAARNGYKDLCKTLVDYGADVDAENNNGRTASRVAEKRGHPNTASWLRKQE
jgi:ankyrin repeat protein